MSYHYLIMSELDFLKVQSIEEILRERANYYTIENNHQNYWIVTNPLFLKTEKYFDAFKRTAFYSQNKKNSSYIALISTNEAFINWLQLRIGYFEFLDIKNEIVPLSRKIKSDGIAGKIEETVENTYFYFKSILNISSNLEKLSSIS